MPQNPSIFPYTLCFCLAEDKVLMLYRNKSPNQQLWNGIGGKIEQNENHKDGVIREAKEETGIDLHKADSLLYTGVVTWEITKDSEKHSSGMYVYLARLSPQLVTWNKQETAEGTLEWKPLNWVLDKNNKQVVDNIAYFLPLMLKNPQPMAYHCVYKQNILKKFSMQKLSSRTRL